MADFRAWNIGLLKSKPISFPNTGGMTVSSHALSANFHFPVTLSPPCTGEAEGI
jgi:hypothetical protein